MPSNDNFISRTVQSGVATAGGYAGGVVDVAGKSVSGAGRNMGNRSAHTFPHPHPHPQQIKPETFSLLKLR